MSQMDREARPQFSQPVRQIALMLMVIALSAAMVFVAAPSVLPVFQANPYLNGFIFFVFLIGVVACFWQVVQLVGSVRWIEGFAADTQQGDETPPQLLAPLASLLRTRGARMQVSSSSTRSILDSVATPSDFPWPSGHFLRSGDHRSCAGRHHSQPCPARRRRGRGCVRSSDGRAGFAA